MIGSRRRTPATFFIIGMILLGFVVEIFTGAVTNPVKLAVLGAIVREWIVGNGQWWRLVSAMFLHGDGTLQGGVLHLGMNLLALYQLGTIYELMFGTRRFVTIYFVAGVVASLTSMIVNGGPSVGASGAVFGIMGAFVFSILRSPRFRHERAARSIVNQVMFWTLANIAIGMRVPQIDNSAHIGGLIKGLLLGALWPHRVPPPPPTSVVVDVAPYDQ
jgi:rhomboid protease GluP